MFMLSCSSARQPLPVSLALLQLHARSSCRISSPPSILAVSRTLQHTRASGGSPHGLHAHQRRPNSERTPVAAPAPRFCHFHTPTRSITAHNLSLTGPLSRHFPLTKLHISALQLFLAHPPSDLDKAHFSSSGAAMGATKLDGTAIAKRIRENLTAEIEEKRKINPRFIPSLKIIQGVCIRAQRRHNMSL